MGLCRGEEEAFQAGFAADCEHDTDPDECALCRLSDADITRLAMLIRPYLAAPLEGAA